MSKEDFGSRLNLVKSVNHFQAECLLRIQLLLCLTCMQSLDLGHGLMRLKDWNQARSRNRSRIPAKTQIWEIASRIIGEIFSWREAKNRAEWLLPPTT